MATNSNSENARSRMVASLRGSVGTEKKNDESITGRVWAGGYHHVTARSRLAPAWKLMDRSFLQFSKFFRSAVNADTESADSGVRLCVCVYLVLLVSVTSSSGFPGVGSLVCRRVVGLPVHRIVSSIGDTNIPATLDSRSASVRCSFNFEGFTYSIMGNKADVFDKNLFFMDSRLL